MYNPKSLKAEEFISDEENIEFIKNAKSAEEVAKAINEFEPEE